MVAAEGSWLNGTDMVVDVGKVIELHLRLYITMTYIPAGF